MVKRISVALCRIDREHVKTITILPTASSKILKQKTSPHPRNPGMKKFYSDVNYTKKKGNGLFNLAAYWKRKSGGKQEQQPWYILTNLDTFEQVIKTYQGRFSIEAMFRDCKSGETPRRRQASDPASA